MADEIPAHRAAVNVRKGGSRKIEQAPESASAEAGAAEAIPASSKSAPKAR